MIQLFGFILRYSSIFWLRGIEPLAQFLVGLGDGRLVARPEAFDEGHAAGSAAVVFHPVIEGFLASEHFAHAIVWIVRMTLARD